jgi:hypothetical protein
MPLLYRKSLRDAVTAILADQSNGFNARLDAAAITYGIVPFAIDFSGASRNFAQTYIDPVAIEMSNLLDINPCGGTIYTEEAQDTGEPRGAGSFCGAVLLCLDWYVRDREGIESDNTEDFLDAIEAAALGAINWPGNVFSTDQTSITLARRSKMPRERLIPLADGFATRIPMQMQFNVFDQTT